MELLLVLIAGIAIFAFPGAAWKLFKFLLWTTMLMLIALLALWRYSYGAGVGNNELFMVGFFIAGGIGAVLFIIWWIEKERQRKNIDDLIALLEATTNDDDYDNYGSYLRRMEDK
jgi:uncharacterized membrane protein